ncbi:S-methyl-5-thioribose kinase [Chthonobacter albigriseus]|uniref:S-methyl-5-thioribose kinase n=1 Tax=Chthonobacter albigriseus TaxID=1683161 RepID=UPI0015EE59BD|nr:S-methyl-5-thioribose kinase [Chthonobacter albigriseus]
MAEEAASGSYSALGVESIGARLGNLVAMKERLGSDIGSWRAREVGDGNLNLVFIVESPVGGVVVKQALPYVRLVGDSWPLPLKRSFFEYHALIRQAERDPGRVPGVFHFDVEQALIVQEYLTPHIILRRSLIAGTRHPHLAGDLGRFCARTLFRGSDLSMKAADRKADLALFADNVALCDITENLVFTDPYFAAPLNRHTAPQLDALVARLRADVDLKVEAQHLKTAFTTRAETLLHGDLHTGSVMVTGEDTRVIDPEFAVYGPMGFDVGMLLANFWMACFAQSGHEEGEGARDAYRAWILDVVHEIWSTFAQTFTHLWRTERTGMLYPAALYEDQGHAMAAEQALHHRLQAIWTDALGFAGVEIHRRILGLAHIAEFETIADPAQRAAAEAKALVFGRHLVVNRARIPGLAAIRSLAERLEGENIA